MTKQEFIIEVLDKIAWPSLLLVFVLIFKGSLRQLFKRLESIGTKYGTLNFRESLDEAKGEADKAKLPEISEGFAKDEVEYYEDLSRISPRSVVLEAWLQLETAVEGIIRRPPEGRPRSFGPEARVLLKIAGLEKDEITVFYDLRNIRNRVVHEEDARVSKDQAIEYAELALRLASKIRKNFGR